MSQELTEVNIDSDDIQFEEVTSSSGFGGGLELLMNTNRKAKNSVNGNDEQSDVDLSELKELSDQLDSEAAMPSRKKASMLFSDNDDEDSPTVRLNLGNEPSEKIKLVEDESNNKTWDGFQKLSNIPNEADKAIPEHKQKKEDILREKFVYLRKLEALEQKGVRLTKQYSMESNLDEMRKPGKNG